MGAFFFPLAAVAKPLLLAFSGLSLLVGLLAIASPRSFTAFVAFGNHWIDTARLFHIPTDSRLRALDRWVDLDHYALGHARLVGTAVAAAGGILAYLCAMLP